MTARSRLVAFFLSILPGLPQFYLGRSGFGTLLIIPSIVLYLAGPFFALIPRWVEGSLFCIFGLFILWIISNIHAQASFPSQPPSPSLHDGDQLSQHPAGLRHETFIMTALIPGGGQLYLGEASRGLPLLVAFFAWLTFTAYLAINLAGGFIVLWGLLPVIWVYSLFDAQQGWRRSLQANTPPRPSLLDELEATTRTHHRKNRSLAVALSAIPGLGHLYLGEMGVGLALLASFLLLLSLNNLAYINLGFVVVPLIWFYSVFDVLARAPQLASDGNAGRRLDPYMGQRWLGLITLGSGLLILVERLVMPYLSPRWIHQLQPLILAVILMAVGGRLLLGSRIAPRGDRADQSTEGSEGA